MKIKTDRQKAILELVRSTPLSTQAELRDALRHRGIKVDQATISRDLRELGIVRVADPEGRFRYGTVEELSPGVRAGSHAVLGRFIRSIDATGNLLVIKTDSGTAPTVGEALDRLGLKDIVGTVAGDNTLFAALREGVRGSHALKRIREEMMGR